MLVPIKNKSIGFRRTRQFMAECRPMSKPVPLA